MLAIAAYDFDEFYIHDANDPVAARRQYLAFVDQAIDRILASGEVLIEDEPGPQLPLFPSEAIVI